MPIEDKVKVAALMRKRIGHLLMSKLSVVLQRALLVVRHRERGEARVARCSRDKEPEQEHAHHASTVESRARGHMVRDVGDAWEDGVQQDVDALRSCGGDVSAIGGQRDGLLLTSDRIDPLPCSGCQRWPIKWKDDRLTDACHDGAVESGPPRAVDAPACAAVGRKLHSDSQKGA